ncbi:MAG TPA: PilZ domain-containing protein [Dissulfurispiraceae bacterium]|nr:PilZ domain-containing protein [Dissulfurispiraceae bacterium]
MDDHRHPGRISEGLKYRLRNQRGGWVEGIVHISARGMRFVTNRLHTPGQVLVIDIVRNRDGMPDVFVRVTGRVISALPMKGCFDIALEFIDLNEDIKRILSRISERQIESPVVGR